MSNLIMSLDQIIVGFFSLIVIVLSFIGLNNCTKHTKTTVRIPLVLYFTASFGVLLLLAQGIRVQWPTEVFITAVAFTLAAERRREFKPTKLYHPIIR